MIKYVLGGLPWLRRFVARNFNDRSPVSIPCQSIRYSSWTKWRWDGVFSVYLSCVLHYHSTNAMHFFCGKGPPAADATDAPQPWGLLCNPMMKMISFFFSFFRVMEQRWTEIYVGKPKYSRKNLSQCQFVHYKSQCTDPELNPGLCGERPEPWHGHAMHLFTRLFFHSFICYGRYVVLAIDRILK
jgi:hypothetical protein